MIAIKGKNMCYSDRVKEDVYVSGGISNKLCVAVMHESMFLTHSTSAEIASQERQGIFPISCPPGIM
ncbi:hypothetical protein M514_27847 [Trichuris suis]|uniref:Uncharacterized protein n=1 Tax=Trichuris suis TaxID=68888 RepID=A0A085MRX9_9BILA|nr:hypothetical protein M514_27847 [Trichuris suis]